jgi:hypothetical protein
VIQLEGIERWLGKAGCLSRAGILAKLDADPAIRQAVLVSRSGPIRSVPRPTVATGGFRGLFEALKKGVPTASSSPPGRNDHSSPLGMRPRYTAVP